MTKEDYRMSNSQRILERFSSECQKFNTIQRNQIEIRKESTLKRLSGLKNSSTSRQNQIIKLNIGGTTFQTYKRTLNLISDSRLARITESNSDFDQEKNEFFFDRDPTSFLAILNYYRTGKLHAPRDICSNLFFDELTYWGIEENSIQPCCWTNYNQSRECDEILKMEKEENETGNGRLVNFLMLTKK